MDEVRLPLRHGTPASAARRTTEDALEAWNLTELTDDASLVATELVQNVTQHTDDGGELRLERHDDRVIIEVTDTSSESPQVRASAHRTPGGRGMALVAAVALRWGTRPAVWAGQVGKVVWAELAKRLAP
jgi:anti-sigma regulatory factor (Ser/Thr protein kinase)